MLSASFFNHEIMAHERIHNFEHFLPLQYCCNCSNQGIRKRWMQCFLPKKSPSIFSCLDLILWPNVSNIFGDDFVPHHLVFYEIF